MSEQHFNPSKDRHVQMAEQVIQVIEDADGWITTPELADQAGEDTDYSDQYVRSKLYYMQDYLESEGGVDLKKEPRDGKSGGDPAWHFKKQVSKQE